MVCFVFYNWKTLKFPPGLEPGTFRVLGKRDNHYTTETCNELQFFFSLYKADTHYDVTKIIKKHMFLNSFICSFFL